jgi:hypothetical protein
MSEKPGDGRADLTGSDDDDVFHSGSPKLESV